MKVIKESMEFPIPTIVEPEIEITVDEIEAEDNKPTTVEEDGAAGLLTNCISDTWKKINEYKNMIATIQSLNMSQADDIISVIKSILDNENENVGKLITILGTVAPETKHIECGQQEVDNMLLTEDFTKSTASELARVLNRSISNTEENYIFDNWRAFYDEPSKYEGTVVVDMVNQDLNELNLTDDQSDKSKEDEITEVPIEEPITESVQPKAHVVGTLEYDANEGKKSRTSMYRKLRGLTEDFQITEDNIDDWAVNKVATKYNRTPKRVRAELLNKI